MTETESPARSAAFQRAFVAVSYFAGARGERLRQSFPQPAPETEKLISRLNAADRAERAAALAHELERIALRLEQRRLFK